MQPIGTVTFLFTDIEGSTRLWDRHPKAMQQALTRHDAIMKEALAQHNGAVVKGTGDGFHVVFEAAADALRAALAAQQALAAEPWPGPARLRVRMGLHSGQAELREGDYYGTAVNRAARLMALAAGGQVLLSTATAELARDHLPPELTLANLGQQRLTGLARPEQVFQLTHPDLVADFPTLQATEATPHNLPEQLTSFVGRQKDLASLEPLLDPAHSDPTRLVTLIGPGGTGKSRLALNVAGRLLDRFPDGVWLVELAPLADPQLVTQTVAGLFSLRERPGGRPLLDMLIDFLRRRRVLLILDNCEHLIDACARLAEALLRACPDLRILASSREALGIGGERAYRVPPLSLPAEANGSDAAESEAVQLFVARARTAHADFVLAADNAEAVAQICRRLDGIPLAIELAAARIGVLSAAQIAARLDDRFRLLTGGSRTALPRQRTLQALIDWSYDLLSEPECTLLRRLAVFSGGWTLEAAEAVASDEELDRYQILDLLEHLVQKSLVVVEKAPRGRRYGMLETIRQYAQERLAASGSAEHMRDRHLAHFVGETRRAMEEMRQLSGGVALERLTGEGDNLRAARAWALEHDLRAALQLAGGLTWRWSQLTTPLESLRFIEAVLPKAEAEAETFAGEDSERRRLIGAALASAATVSLGIGLMPQTLDYAQRSIAIAGEVEDLNTLAWALGMAASASGLLGRLEQARHYGQKALSVIDRTGNRWMQATILITHGNIFRPESEAERESAWASWEQGMAMFRQAGELHGLAWGHQMAAAASLAAGQHEAAQEHAVRSLALYTEIGDLHLANVPRSALADLARRRGDFGQATTIYRQALQVWYDVGNVGAVARIMECLAFMLRAQETADNQTGALNRAATLLGAAEALRSQHQAPMNFVERREYEHERAALEEALAAEAFAADWQRGQAMTLRQALSLALEG